MSPFMDSLRKKLTCTVFGIRPFTLTLEHTVERSSKSCDWSQLHNLKNLLRFSRLIPMFDGKEHIQEVTSHPVVRLESGLEPVTPFLFFVFSASRAGNFQNLEILAVLDFYRNSHHRPENIICTLFL